MAWAGAAPRTLRWAWPEGLVAIGVLALAAVVLWQTSEIPVSPIYAAIGPRFFPYLAAGGIALFGLCLLVRAARGGWQPDEQKQAAPDRPALWWVVAGLVANVVLIVPAGFTIASVAMFVCVARAFGSRRIARDALIGAAFALIAYFGFAKALGINIGGGLVEEMLEGALRAVTGRAG